MGEISWPGIQKKAPDIVRLKQKSAEPITLYIDSPGGSVYWAKQLLSLLRSPTQGNTSFEVVTVAVNMAASAAAYVLVNGSFAIAYSCATIHFHGTRLSGDVLTSEKAADLAENLLLENLRLADILSRRVLSNIASLALLNKVALLGAFSIDDYVALVKDKLSSKAFGLVQGVGGKVRSFLEVFVTIKSVTVSPSDSFKFQSKLLEKVLASKSKSLKAAGYSSFPRVTINETTNLIFQTQELYSNLERSLEQILPDTMPFLDPVLASKCQHGLEALEDHEREMVFQDLVHQILPWWLFCNLLARGLQEGENQLSARDCYWLGLISEVAGSELPTIRDITKAKGA